LDFGSLKQPSAESQRGRCLTSRTEDKTIV
jgi:hypothetical protein